MTVKTKSSDQSCKVFEIQVIEIRISNTQHVFCILGRLKNVSCILYLNTKILVFEYLKYIQHIQIQFRLISSLYMASQ